MIRPFSALAVLILLGAARSPAANLPAGFAEVKIADGLNPTTMHFLPDGRLLLCEKQGLLRGVAGGKMLPKPLLDITRQVDAWNERGLLSVCSDPAFASNGWIYVYYTHLRKPGDAGHESSNNRVSRFTFKGGSLDPASELVLLEIDNLSKVGWHNGGGLAFGKDGKLYIGTGENAVAPNAQNPANLLGKLLRINKDGSIPKDNPHYAAYEGKNRAIVALGLRNAFSISVQPDTGVLYLSMVGANFEQIERYETGKAPEVVNYGWPTFDGPPKKQPLPEGYRAPEHPYDHGKDRGVALCGGDFYNPSNPGAGAFPAAFTGSFFFSDYGGWIKYIDPAKPDKRHDFATGINRPIDVATAPDGALWYVERAGISGGSDAANSASTNGALWRVTWTGLSQAAEGSPSGGTKAAQPDKSNALSPPEISPSPGSYSGPVWVSLSSKSPGTVVRYTLDGKDPDVKSSVFTAPFEISANTTVKAIAFPPDLKAGTVAAAKFRITGNTPYGVRTRPPVSGLKLPASTEGRLPPTLADTGLFKDNKLTPSPGVVPYSLNATVWADGATIRRWVALPESGKIGFSKTGEYQWPGGTVLVQHFDLPQPGQPKTLRPLETRVLVLDKTGAFGYGVSYRWRDDGSGADLVADAGQVEQVKTADPSGALSQQVWNYPPRGACYLCHTPVAGFVLGPKTHQLNGPHTYDEGRSDNQIRTWNYLGMFREPVAENTVASLPKAVALDAPGIPAEDRFHSYLDANCSHCHRPGGTGATWDGRFGTPLSAQDIISGAVRNNLGLADAKLIAPGDLRRSLMHYRMVSTDPIAQMPPVTRNVPDKAALAVLEEWIRSLPAKSP